ncbi:hypothetical protein ACFPN2_08360 [Steroidobacter flavus]|uniref:Uncharacterized protein n=1 Tax=Steroidobacter flavus TaxID=1842136 RepID=A0ABV8SNE1_9GAMM
MKLNYFLRRALAREKTVLWISIVAGAVGFCVIYSLSHVASWLGQRVIPADLMTAGIWFLRISYAFFVMGSAINVIGLLIAFLRGKPAH